MNHLTFYSALTFLCLRICCRQGIGNISRVLIMLHNHGIATGHTLFIAKISNGFSDFFDTFSCNGEENVSMLEILRIVNNILTCMGHALMEANIIHGIDFTIANTRNPICGYFISLDTGSTINVCCKISQRNKSNTKNILAKQNQAIKLVCLSVCLSVRRLICPSARQSAASPAGCPELQPAAVLQSAGC